MLCDAQSGRAIAAYVYTAAGLGESTTDLAWDGQALIYENGQLLRESERFADERGADRRRPRPRPDPLGPACSTSSYGDSIHDLRERVRAHPAHRVRAGPARSSTSRCSGASSASRTSRPIPVSRNERCEEVYNIQVRGLQTRLLATGIEKIVIGVSGGLDSTHALIVAARTMDRLGLPRTNVLGYTLPGFATSARHAAQRPRADEGAGRQRGRDRHPSRRAADAARPRPPRRRRRSPSTTSPTRTSRPASGPRTCSAWPTITSALVLGTGDLSELALGWSTYGVGDQMSHYNVNASVPKTLIRLPHPLGHRHRPVRRRGQRRARRHRRDRDLARADPASADADHDGPEQHSEDTVGPYELQDFFLYYILRFGYRPSKVAFLAQHAWGDRERGDWPDLIPARAAQRSTRSSRSASGSRCSCTASSRPASSSAPRMPNAPKVGSGGSLSPRVGLARTVRQPGHGVAPGAAHPGPRAVNRG